MDTVDFTLIHPFSAIIAGPSGAGKSSLVFKIIQEREHWIKSGIKKVLYIYLHYEPEFFKIQQADPDITFSNDIADIDNWTTPDSLIVIDDCINYLLVEKHRQAIEQFFIRKSHHLNISIICILQNIFPKNLRLVSINAQYFILFNFPRDKSSVMRMAAQCNPGNSRFITDAYIKACSKQKHGHLVLDFHPKSPNVKFFARLSLFADDCDVYIE